MSDNGIQQVSPSTTALNAEHYQTFEMAKANDDILGGDNIAQIRSYAAYARAQAQAIHKSIAAMGELEDVAQAKAEMTETSQTFAKVSVYADTRIGELLRGIEQAKRGPKVNSPIGEKTKADAIKEAGIGNRQAYDLQAMAANPEVVEAVIAKAESEGRIVSRSQVLKAIKERDAANKALSDAQSDLEESYRASELLESQIESLKRQVAEKSKPEVIEREVVREVVPDDYDETKRKVEGLRRENERLNREYHEMWQSKLDADKKLEQANELLGERERNSDANRDVEQFINNIYTFLNRHGGKSRAFDQFYRVDDTTQEECRKALVALGGFVQSLLPMTEERMMIGAAE